MIWHQFPALRLLISAVLGILLHSYSTEYLGVSTFLIGLLLFLQFILKIKFKRNPKVQLFRGLLINVLFFLLGYTLSLLQAEKFYPNHYLNTTLGKEATYWVKLDEQPLKKGRWWRVEAQVLSFKTKEAQEKIRGQLMLYLELDSARQKPNFGDQLLLYSSLNELEEPKNPNAFNYKKYLANKAIYAQAFVLKDNWEKIKNHSNWSPKSFSVQIRESLLRDVENWPVSRQVKNLSKALLLGFKAEIDQETLQSYSKVGATHILAVSGLHVGVIYLLGNYLLSFLTGIIGGARIQSLLMLIILWCFAFIAGLSPSVLRAVCMFSFVAFAGLFKREASIYNTLIASALFLLLVSPSYWFDVGFQLSYAAVFFIVWIQGKLDALWSPGNWLLNKIWAISTVSIAAQIGTLPLSLYYFHQFPVYFLLSNLMVIPIVSVLMYLGMANLLIGQFLDLKFLKKVYGFLMEFMNTGIHIIEKIPGGLIENIHLEIWEPFNFYTMIILLFSWLFQGKKWKLRLLALLLIFHAGSKLFEEFEASRSPEFWIYSLKGDFAMSYINHDHFHLIASKAVLENSELIRFNIQGHIMASNPNESCFLDYTQDSLVNELKIAKGLIQIQDLSFWVYDPKKSIPNIDHWIVGHRIIPPRHTNYYPKELIITSWMNPQNLKKWEIWCQTHNVKLVNVLESGAYQIANF